jgi:ABC-type transporter Mla subunit MlaD
MADAAVEKAKELIAQAQDYIDQNKPELARQAINKLNVLKDVMPPAIQVQIDKLNALIGGEAAPAPAVAPTATPTVAPVAVPPTAPAVPR